jgi:hypothetical protein
VKKWCSSGLPLQWRGAGVTRRVVFAKTDIKNI